MDSPSFDLIGLSTGIEVFGRDNLMTPKMVRNLNLVFEELTSSTLVRRPETLPIRAEIEYSDVDEAAQMTVTYGGPAFDPLESGDELSATIVRKLSAAYEHSFDTQNRIVLHLK